MDSEIGVVTLISEERGNSGSSVRSIVVSKLRKGQEFRPVILLIIAVHSDVLFEGLIDTFGLAVAFRVVPRGKVEFHVQCFSERPEEMGDKLRTSVQSDVGRDTVFREDV